MLRIVRLTPRFAERRAAVGATKGPAARALAAAIAAVSRDVLPGPGDFETLIPPVRQAWVRRVAGFNLWVLYRFDDAHVTVLTVTAVPPVPVAE